MASGLFTAKQLGLDVVFFAPLLTAITPTIGSGQTFVRATTALDPDDYASVSSGTARFSANGWFGEPQRTNLALRSRDFDDGYWVKSGTITATANQTGIDGAANTAHTLTDSDAASAAFITHSWTVANDNNSHTVQIFVLKDNDETRFPELEYYISGGTTLAERVQLNTKTGDTGVRLTSNGSHVVTDDGDWWRVSITITNNTSGNTSLNLRIKPAAGHTTLGANLDATLTGSIVVDACQLESNVTYPTTFIPTTTASVTRNADDLSYTWPSGLANDFVIAFDWTPSVDDQGTIWLPGNYTDASNAVGILHDGTNIIGRKRIAGVNNDATKALNYVVGTTYDIKMRLGPNGTDIWVDDVKGTGDATATDATVAATFGVGNDGNSANFQSGSIKNLRIIKGDLSDAAVVSL